MSGSSENMQPPGERPRREIRTYMVRSDNVIEEVNCYPLEFYGTCPQVGDTIIGPGLAETGPRTFRVDRRFFVEESAVFSGWALILEEISPSGLPEKLWTEWNEATAFWDDVAAEEKMAYELDVVEKALGKVTKP
ncbi:hypothetical protein QTL95_27110 [Rhizobium sp. S152]|uniref:hypothetical protein n=1 Tax=Rhizobium sp. S152 TaxID=3055038 RepID=UPI0025A9B878|nr:hypothetical protein [Rhizobium sp. S152]MDM9629559.1 hypothetical protein [Rhizobium sp. S152]